MDAIAIENMRTPSTGEIYTLNLETVQVLWFYNKTAFEKAGILQEAEELAKTERNQPTWDLFMSWSEKLKSSGYIPVAIEGDYRSFWELRFGWLARMYLDQFTRDEAELVRAQPGDWNFRQGIDDVWKYDPTDPHNDDAAKITFNNQRKMIALRDHKQPVTGPKFEALYTNFKQFSDLAAPPGWLGTKDAYPLFLTQEAAIRLDVAALLGNFERDINSLSQGKYIPAGGAAEGEPTPTPLPGRELETFEIGSFNNPTMEGPEVDAPARTIEVNIGFLSVPKKDQAQNDLELDFLMWLTSPEGFGLYLKNRLDPNNAGSEGINGPPIVKDVELPADLAAKFAQLKLIGNTEKDTAGTYRARGIADYQPSVREWVDLSQQYFAGDIELKDYLDQYQASVDRLFGEILTHQQLTADDLADPSKKPASQV
jgi:ABC-type glycerol-3-phosphate transport system substrate-binding protein